MTVSILPSKLDALGANLERLDAAETIARILRERGVQVVALKGIAMLAGVYRGREHLRPMSDIDLWCRSEDEATFRGLAEELGYTSLSHLDGAFARVEAGDVVRRGRAVHVDLHTRLEPWNESALEAVWSRTVSVDGSALRVLSTEDQIIHTIHHAVARHAHLRPSWRRDIEELLRRPHDALRVVREAQRLDVTEILGVGLESCAPDSNLAKVVRDARGQGSIRSRIRTGVLRRSLRGPEVEAHARIAQLLTTTRPIQLLYRLILPSERDLAGRHGRGLVAVRRVRRLWTLAQRAVRSVRRPE